MEWVGQVRSCTLPGCRTGTMCPMGELGKDRGAPKGWWAQTCSRGLWTLPGGHQEAPGANPVTCRDWSCELDQKGKDLKGIPQTTMWTRRISQWACEPQTGFGGKCQTWGEWLGEFPLPVVVRDLLTACKTTMGAPYQSEAKCEISKRFS